MVCMYIWSCCCCCCFCCWLAPAGWEWFTAWGACALSVHSSVGGSVRSLRRPLRRARSLSDALFRSLREKCPVRRVACTTHHLRTYTTPRRAALDTRARTHAHTQDVTAAAAAYRRSGRVFRRDHIFTPRRRRRRNPPYDENVRDRGRPGEVRHTALYTRPDRGRRCMLLVLFVLWRRRLTILFFNKFDHDPFISPFFFFFITYFSVFFFGYFFFIIIICLSRPRKNFQKNIKKKIKTNVFVVHARTHLVRSCPPLASEEYRRRYYTCTPVSASTRSPKHSAVAADGTTRHISSGRNPVPRLAATAVGLWYLRSPTYVPVMI